MSERTLQSEVLDQPSGSPLEKQRQVLNFARLLAESTGRPGKEMLLFGVAIDAGDLGTVTEAIEDGCGQVNAL